MVKLDNGTAAGRLRTLVKPLVRSLLLKVHPDFYAHEPAAKKINSVNVQKLQDLLSPVLKDTHSHSKHTTLEFMYRPKPGQLKSINATFAASKDNSRLVQLQIQRAQELLDLCRQLDMPADPETTSEIQKLVDQMADNPMSKAALRAARAREARSNYMKGNKSAPSSVALEFMSKLQGSGWHPGSMQKQAARLELDRSKVFFADSVDPTRYSSIIQMIERQLHRLNYSHWSMLPVMVVNSWKDALRGEHTKYPGFIVIPHQQFDKLEFVRYLRENLDSIRGARQSLIDSWFRRQA